jgi:HAD superfamily hydrolase (TIGR01450 family)
MGEQKIGEKQKIWLGDKNLFIFDVEGVILPSIDEPSVEDETLYVVDKLREKGKKIAFVTNISRTSWMRVSNTLIKFGVAKSPDEVFTAGKIAVEYVKAKWEKSKRKVDGEKPKVFVISERGLLADFESDMNVEVKFSKPVDFVVVGMKRNLTFDELNFALECVLEGAELISVGQTNYYKGEFLGKEGVFFGDVPICEMIAYASGRSFTRIGKPYPIIYEFVLKKYKVKSEEAVMIGDKIETDVKGANEIGITSVLVKPLISKRHFVAKREEGGKEIKPTLRIKNLKELLKYL